MKTFETWQNIPGYVGYYQASNFGNIRSLNRVIKRNNGRNQTFKGQILATQINKDGYKIVRLAKNGERRTYRIHRLVALTFKPNINSNILTVDHIDGDKCNNDISNLQWLTATDNILKSNIGKTHSNETRQKISKARTGKPQDKKEYSFINKNLGIIFIGTTYDFRIKYNLNPGNCSHLIHGKYKQLKGWELL